MHMQVSSVWLLHGAAPCLCSKFTYAFNTSAVETQSQVKMDSFDSSVLQIEQDDIHRFVEYLQVRAVFLCVSCAVVALTCVRACVLCTAAPSCGSMTPTVFCNSVQYKNIKLVVHVVS